MYSTDQQSHLVVDDFLNDDLVTRLGSKWVLVTDQVIGGTSKGRLRKDIVEDRDCLRLTGDVSIGDQGGFIQASVGLTPDGSPLDATDFSGLRLTVSGNDENYECRIRTAQMEHTWEAYTTEFRADFTWHNIELPFEKFVRLKTNHPLDLSQLTRVALVAKGSAFSADLCLASLMLYR